MSINALDENFKNDMDNASSITNRLETLKILHNQGIYTILFMSPIFPKITDCKAIIEQSKLFVDEYWFENLNLRGSYKTDILAYIKNKYPQYLELYEDIYLNGQLTYFEDLSIAIECYCKQNKIKYKNFFYHEKLVKAKNNESK